jgi:hypothetical protein
MQTQNTIKRLHTALTTTTVLALGIAVASAHPGHAANAEPVSHLATSPYHLLTLTVVGAGMLLGTVFVKRLAARRAMQITGVAALAGAAVTFASQLML